MNRTKRSLRSTLEELSSALAEAVLAAARESLFELAASQARAEPRRARVARPAPKRAKVVRVERRPSPPQSVEAPGDQLITDPQALLAALETASPASYPSKPPDEVIRKEPEILRAIGADRSARSVEAPSAMAKDARVFVPTLRAGEEILRSSGAGIVLRRRRV